MLNAGKSRPVVARQLGHASSEITSRVDEHLLDDGPLDDALEAFDRGRIAQRIAQPTEAGSEEAQTRLD